MTYEQPSSLSFSIKESVWLERGKEIDEILSLALEPDISVHEEEDQVFVRGALQLFGEYRPKQERGEQSDSNSFSDQVAFRSVEEVSMTDDGIGMIRHSFPLDVTIPKNRVNSLQNLYVTVDEFDYELPGRGCIELEASVSVSGIKNERTSYTSDEGNHYDRLNDNYHSEATDTGDVSPEPYEVEYEEPRVDYQEYQFNPPEVEFEPEEAQEEETDERSFHFEAVRPAEEEDNVTYEAKEEEEEEMRYQEEEFGEVEPNLEHQEEPETAEMSPADTEPEYEEEDVVEVREARESTPVAPTVNFSSNPATTTEARPPEASEDSDDGADEPKREENALYLTKMLTKGEEEFSKLKMCIVQEGETLDLIAERYGIQVSQLVRMNRLNDERVAEGEILYIPVKKTVSADS